MKQLKKQHLKTKIFSHLMSNGQKKTCEKKILKTLKLLQKAIKRNHKNVLKLVIINLAPTIQIKKTKKKKRKTTKEFPFFLNEKNRIFFSLKSITILFKQKSKTNMYSQLKDEILLNAQNKSEVIKKKEILQNYALTKKKYLHYRWFC
jgi:ribosomal protein S7